MKVKKIIVIGIIIFIILIVGVSIMIKYLDNKSEKIAEETGDPGIVIDYDSQTTQKVTDFVNYYTVVDCVDAYIDRLNIRNSSYYGMDENNNYSLRVSDEDINWHMVGTVLNPDENSELFMDYYNGDLPASDILKHFDLKSEKLARMCFSFKGLSLFDRTEFERVLRRVRMFGFEHSLASDKIYAQLYQYLLESGVPCGPKKKTVSSYGIRFVMK